MAFANKERIARTLEALAQYGATTGGGVTRLSYTEEYRAAQDYLRREMEAAGLTVRIDPMGNLIGRREGADSALAALAVGSHLDSVRNGGRFDGAMGVVCGLELARMLREDGLALRHPFEAVAIVEEEGNSFGSGILGGRALAGLVETDFSKKLTNADGVTAYDVMAAYGLHPEALAEVKRSRDDWACFIEPHIEQGPVLESEGLSVGIVDAIVGICTRRIVITGRPDHGGTTPMHLRLDAMVAASKVVQLADSLAKELHDGTVATCGLLRVEPGAINVVPGRVEMTLDCRSSHQASIDTVVGAVETLLEQLRTEGYGVEMSVLMDSAPVRLSQRVAAALKRGMAENGLPVRTLPSGAGHDAMFISRVTDVGMLFVSSRNGRSHCPEEFTDTADIARCCDVVYSALKELDRA